MKQVFIVIFCLSLFGQADAQGVTLLYKGGAQGIWDDPQNWIQTDAANGQMPIQRVPTELDAVVFSRTQSGLPTVSVSFDPLSPHIIKIGDLSTSGYRCKSMRVSNTDLSLAIDFFVSESPFYLDVYTTNGGFIVIDSGSNFRYGRLQLHGGNSAVNDLEVNNSSFGSLFSHNDWSNIHWDAAARARFTGSALGGYEFASNTTGGTIYANNCNFTTLLFRLGDNSTDTIINSSIHDDINTQFLTFAIGKNAAFVSSNVEVNPFKQMLFYTSGSVLNGNVHTVTADSYVNFGQEDPTNPLPNIINGDLTLYEDNSVGISGDLKISGNMANITVPQAIYPDTAHVFINGQDIFEVGGITNYGNNLFITTCVQNYCHFNLEFFGNSNSNINWPIGFPVDTLVVNKSGCAKLTSTNSLYVSGQAKIKAGQLRLDPNDNIPYKFVCAGDLNIEQGGGIFLRKDPSGKVANVAVAGAINDYNSVTDSACTGLSNPYNGDITLFRNPANTGENKINIASSSNIGNINLVGPAGTNFMLGSNLAVQNFTFANPVKLELGNYNLAVNASIANYGPPSYFITNGSGYLQINNIGNSARVFPVGTADSYTPASLTNLGTPDNFNVHVQPGVLSAGIAGSPYIAGVVNRTWDINKTTAGPANVNLALQWNAADELPGFTRSASYVSHYTLGSWNNAAPGAAAGSDPYMLTTAGITNFSPFAVMSAAAVVPLSFGDFTGKFSDGSITLNWNTLTESNTSYFSVEKSNDAVSFGPLAKVSAHGNSQSGRSYRYIDNSVINPVNFYRLKITDVDLKFQYSKTITVSAPLQHSMSIFPNPVHDALHLRSTNRTVASTITIIDSKGSTVKKLEIPARAISTVINVSALPAGHYSLIVNSGGQFETIPFVKQ